MLVNDGGKLLQSELKVSNTTDGVACPACCVDYSGGRLDGSLQFGHRLASEVAWRRLLGSTRALVGMSAQQHDPVASPYLL